jgi:uncharacterized membrane protein
MLMAIGSSALALGVVEIDRSISGTWAARLDWIRDAGPEGTRAVLAAIAGSMITVTGVVFSVTIVALSLASSQFGPRLLHNFMRDRGNQLVLGVLVGTFLYSLLVLRSVGPEGSVPHLATTTAVLLATVSVFVLIYFIHHATNSIQASSIIDAVVSEIGEKLQSLFPERVGEAPESPAQAESALDALEQEGIEILSECEGYIRVLDADALLALASEHDLQIQIRRRPGDFVAVGGSLARMGPVANGSEAMRAAIRSTFVLGPRATAVQDLGFLTDQLTEMAVRALSPGTNDPKTAIACVHRLGALIATLAVRAMPSAYRFDARGQLRVVAPATRFEDIVGRCLDPLRRHGGSHVDVVTAVLESLDETSRLPLSVERSRTLAEHAAELFDAFVAGETSKRDLEQVRSVYEPLMARLERHMREA